MVPESILTLASLIGDNALVLDEFYSSSGHPSPSFGPGALPTRNILPSSSPARVQDARKSLISATRALLDLVLGPAGLLEDINANDVLCMQVIHRYRIAQCFQPGEIVSFEELSSRCGLNVIDLKRVLRLAMTRHVFSEPKCDFVAHTAATRLLAEDERTRSFSGIICEERFPSSARSVEALVKYGESRSSNQSGFSLANNTKSGLYEELKKWPERLERWNSAMSAMAAQINFDFILSSVPFKLYAPGSLFVDVGGGNGVISLGLAKQLPNFRFLVQDAGLHTSCLPSTRTSNSDHIILGDNDTVSWQLHDFFTPQTVVADIYYFRNIFHNWPDAECVQILRNHIPVMRPATRLIIDDFTLHEPLTVSPFEERRRRSMDVTMLVYFGSHERTIVEWQKILNIADPRFMLEKITRDPKQPNAILEISFAG
ncbi:S-adenosyl-L-methionine-dependent methyltransferase [Aspergillus alliaceus]|uniref:S-adenosyl-L-methionine-dependent methyltransferase n=1 Tax=Petromyces alliaceus TaxID=209559 RepID=UPI0012A6065A|nr:S-adenosyl-L-methionine-dependent methyltransferase [Aspergillus alliaceus]KAB8231626.1 S-adenosyl-L-methionine-dependent methyltransferase [Aspergillus alliaceus]